MLSLPCVDLRCYKGEIFASEFGGSSIDCWKRGDPVTQVRRVAGEGAHVSGIHDFRPCRLAISPSGEILVAD